jgi:hypothetical protein
MALNQTQTRPSDLRLQPRRVVRVVLAALEDAQHKHDGQTVSAGQVAAVYCRGATDQTS